MCDFCENIPVIRKFETYDDLLKCEDKGLAREKLILVRYKEKLNFYGFNKHCPEEDALYENIDIKYCPLCGRKLSEGMQKCVDYVRENYDMADFTEVFKD